MRSSLNYSNPVAPSAYVPPAMRERIIRESDPVATVGPGMVRFEGFSSCTSAYARLDLSDEALAVENRQNRTTNVDFGQAIRSALAEVRSDGRLDVSIGAKGVAIAPERAAVHEKKVPLPVRWVRGFGEVHVAMAGMEPRFSTSKIAAQRFIRTIARGNLDHLQWISATPSGLHSAARPTKGAVPLRGGHRVRALEPLAALAKSMDVWAAPGGAASAWRWISAPKD